MKRLILLLTLLLAFAAYSNSQTFSSVATDVEDTIYGEADYVIFYSPYLDEYWDYSIQFKSDLYGDGDSVYFGLQTFQSNDPVQTAWTELTTLADTLLILPDHLALYSNSLLFEKTDVPGVWFAHKLTGVGLDTVIVKPYWVKKMKRYY